MGYCNRLAGTGRYIERSLECWRAPALGGLSSAARTRVGGLPHMADSSAGPGAPRLPRQELQAPPADGEQASRWQHTQEYDNETPSAAVLQLLQKLNIDGR